MKPQCRRVRIIVMVLAAQVPGFVYGCTNSTDRNDAPVTQPNMHIFRLIEDSKAGHRLGRSLSSQAEFAESDILYAKNYVCNQPDYTSFHLLFLMHDRFPDVYQGIPAETKARVLCSALAHTAVMNDWGQLEPEVSHDGKCAIALLNVGKVALPLLVPLLDNKEAAYLFGSEEATLSYDLDYRRADFAYRYMVTILGHQPVFEETVIERDRLIQKLKNAYAARKR